MDANDLVRAASGSCLLLSEEDAAAVRVKADAHDWARHAYRKLLRAGTRRLHEPVTIPDRGGQWPHWYACQSCGARLVTESPTVHRCPACGLVNSGEPWDSVPLTQVHNRLSEDIRTLAVCHALSEDRAFAEKAADILLRYAESYPRYPVRDHHMKTDTVWGAKVSWGTLGEAVWLIPVCQGYDLIRHADVLRPAEHQAIREQLLRPAARLIRKHNIGIHNIQCWHNCAIGMAALVLRDPDLLAFTVDGEVGIEAQLDEGVRDDGMWHEGSWGYHFYGLTPLLAWAVALRNCGKDLFGGLRGMFEAPLDAVRPDGGMPPFHDSGGASIYTQADRYEVALAAYEEAKFALPISGSDRDSLSALLHGVGELPSIPDLPDTSTHLPDSGYIHCRQGRGSRQTYVAFDYGPHGGWHGHPDKLGFILFGRGRFLSPDPGSIAYGVPLYEQWYKQTVSHNTIVVDGTSQAETTGRLGFFVAADGVDIIQADAGDVYEDVRVQRTLVVAKDVVLTADRVRSEHHHTYDWAFHNRGDLRANGFRRRQVKGPIEEGNGYDAIDDLRKGNAEGAWGVTWKDDGAGVRLTMVESKRATEIYTGTGPANIDNPGVGSGTEDVPLVIARRSGRRRTTFAAAFQIFGSRPAKDAFDKVPLEKPERGRAYRYTSGQTDLTLVITFLPGETACGDVRFRGQATVIDRGETERVILCAGDRVRCFGHTVEVHPDASIEVARDDSGLRVTNLTDASAEISVGERSTTLPAGRTWRVPQSG